MATKRQRKVTAVWMETKSETNKSLHILGTCAHCSLNYGEPPVTDIEYAFVIGHKRPKSKGGSDHLRNLQPLHHDENKSGRGETSPQDLLTITSKFIQQQRHKRDMTQEHIALALGISRPTYHQIEHGKRELTISEANTLASTFDMSLAQFLAMKEPVRSVILEKEATPQSSDLQIRVTQKNFDKFKQVLLYVLNKVGGKPNVGEILLHKLLYFIDFDYYEKFEENLMGATYIKNLHGPTSVELGEIIKEMQEQGELVQVKNKHFEYEQKKYLPLKRPDLSVLSGRDIEHIDDVLARHSDKNAAEITHYSHEDIPWQSAQDGKPLSYESVFYRDERYSVRSYDDEL